MITVNQYIGLIEDFLNKHNLINTVLVGDQYDFNAVPDVVYPVGNIEYVRQNIQPTITSDSFEITVADLFDPNVQKSEYRIYSDCNQIADDLVTYFGNQYDVDYEINERVSIEKFSSNVDRTAGCVFVISFDQFRSSNACIIPVDLTSDTFEDEFTGEFGIKID
jgi:hypothetical protein